MTTRISKKKMFLHYGWFEKHCSNLPISEILWSFVLDRVVCSLLRGAKKKIHTYTHTINVYTWLYI